MSDGESMTRTLTLEQLEAELRMEEAERRVIAVRGSRDVPGFEACVQAELAVMAQSKSP